MDRIYSVYWTQSALDELSGILAYPPEVKEHIYLDSFDRLQYTPVLTAKGVESGTLRGLWVRLGLYQVILVFEVDKEAAKIWIYGMSISEKMFVGNAAQDKMN